MTTVEQGNSPEQLIGKNILEVVSLLPTFAWYVEISGVKHKVKIAGLSLVDYDGKRPVTRADDYDIVPVRAGIPLDIGELRVKLSPEPRNGLLA